MTRIARLVSSQGDQLVGAVLKFNAERAMDCFINPRTLRHHPIRLVWFCLFVFVSTVWVGDTADAQQFRTKKPDRGVYQPPVLADGSANSSNRDQASQVRQVSFNQTSGGASGLNPPVLELSPNASPIGSALRLDSVAGGLYDGEPVCGIEAIGGGCDGGGCGGCDGMDGCCCPKCGNGLDQLRSMICFSPERWFGSVEVLMMFRRGDRLPTLVTSGPSTDADTAGEIGQAGTQIAVGGNTIFQNVTAGGRFTLGTWLDNYQCRSLVVRGWLAGKKSYGFVQDQNSMSVIARPFQNVSDNQDATQDTLLVAFPDRANGSIALHGESKVYGGDVSLRKFCFGFEGLTIDYLYGYQFMRLDENLSIGSSSVSLDDDFAPLGSTIAISDSFDIENEFHGGQIGLASSYREGCWSMSGLAKTGFGSIARRANLQGATRTSIDGNTSFDNQGLLVRDTNSGKHTDRTFGWTPELDFTLGWHKFPRFDVTVGYHITAMTDALRVSGAIDSDLAVNLTDPPTGQQRPDKNFDYKTYYIQGIHFGLKYVY